MRFGFVLGFLIVLCSAGVASANIRVIDGDTFDLGSQTIRLHGIDAPERGQRCNGFSVTGKQIGISTLIYNTKLWASVPQAAVQLVKTRNLSSAVLSCSSALGRTNLMTLED